ncbi:mediator of RNA polymerase II transcription subunit 15a-like isoform X2 [Zingiber officinale]|uniref:mediator of RNA polymerase II transcription subunit 15a-like isoform X2 n=1 Tax=Zingiber officinale TaxID=94328 RepID=UPI001C4D2D87|nr:mediator of RNA polymerase II transcription subunit 15a-like isoform X2 [Zingiber officinale]
MEGNSWRPTQEEPQSMPDGSSGDWRSQLQPEARQRIVNKIMETLKRHLPISAPEGLNELQKIAFRYEDKIYTAAANQSDYLRIISLKMLSLLSKSQHAERPGQINPSINQNPADPATLDSIAPTGHATVADLQEGIYQKVLGQFPAVQNILLGA